MVEFRWIDFLNREHHEKILSCNFCSENSFLWYLTNMAIVALIAVGFSAAAPAQQAHVSHAQAVERARQIVAKMTLDEKISELHGVHDATRYRMVPGVPRLGIPDFWMTNGPAGVGPGGASPQPPATAMPAPIALAATWDPELARTYGKLEAEETRSLGSLLFESPDINIARVPQGGRVFESFGEDPFLDRAHCRGHD